VSDGLMRDIRWDLGFVTDKELQPGIGRGNTCWAMYDYYQQQLLENWASKTMSYWEYVQERLNEVQSYSIELSGYLADVYVNTGKIAKSIYSIITIFKPKIKPNI
jgi:hypothetical protein